MSRALAEAAIKRMRLFDSMPEDLQDPSREHGGLVDQMFALGWDKSRILGHLREKRRI